MHVSQTFLIRTPSSRLAGLPDAFARVCVDGTNQVHSTEPCKATLDPKWNNHFDLYLSSADGITISVWNHKKAIKKQGSGFLGCVRILAATIQRLKDTGCEYSEHLCPNMNTIH